MRQNDLQALSLFSGAGGMDIGVIEAGFSILAQVEKDPNCCETLRAAVAREGRASKVIESDIRQIDPESLMVDMGLAPGDLDLLFGGPPCQAFSQIGKQKGLEDERGLLLFQMPRFAAIFRPKVLFIEQVKGLLSSRGKTRRKGEVFEWFLEELQRIGYTPKWKVVNAAEHGVAQLRKRVFIVATSAGNGFTFPAPSHGPSEKQLTLFPLTPYYTVGEAISGLGEPSPKGNQREDSHVDVTPDGDRRRIHFVPEGGHLAAQTHLPEELRGRLTRKDTTKFRRMARDKPSLTLRGGEIFFHPLDDRYLTPREYLRLHGYPDDYLLKGPIRGRSGSVRNLDQHRQVANSVPPPVAKVLAEQIRRIL